MKSVFISQLEPNQLATTSFLVQHKEIRQKKTGEPYLSLLLSDRTGELDAKMWDNVAEVMETFERDDFVKVKGLLQIFHKRPQFTIHKMCRLSDGQVEFADYFPASERDPAEMWTELRRITGEVRNLHLRALLDTVLDDDEVGRRFRAAPAAKNIHHAYLGGLIEHVLSLCHLCRMTAAHYKDIDGDLLIAGAVLHDIGKIYELSYDRAFAYTAEGQLLGHIVLALRLVGDKLRNLPEFPARLRTLVEHMIVSHHGELEFGSPKVPLFLEALLLHYLDNLDAKVECMRWLVAHDRHEEGCFTGYSSALECAVLKKGKYLDGGAVSREKPPAPATEPSLGNLTPTTGSLFGDKLLQALDSPSPNPES